MSRQQPVCALVMAGAVVIVAACGGDGGGGTSTTPSAASTVAVTTTPATIWLPVPTAPSGPTTTLPAPETVQTLEPAAAVDEATAAVRALLGLPSLTVRGSTTEGGLHTFVIDIDVEAGSYHSVEQPDTGFALMFEKIATPTTIYIRTADQSAGGPTEWSIIPVIDPSLEVELPDAYTLFGRATGSLERLIGLWAAVPVQAWRITAADGSRGVRLQAMSDAVARYLSEAGLERTEAMTDSEPSVWDLFIADGRLVRLVASGVQFDDAEPLHDVVVDVTYTPGPVRIVTPVA